MPTSANPPIFVPAGRQTQLAKLQTALADIIAGKPRVVLLRGSAGTGKTALLREFCRQAQVSSSNLIVGYGSCNSQFGIGDPYLPFKEILALLTGDVQDELSGRTVNEENADRLKKFTGHTAEALVELGPDLVGTFIPGAGLLLRAGTFVARKAGWFEPLERLAKNPPRNENYKPEQFFEQFSRVIIRLAQQSPLILVLDDLHWADSGTLELFFYLTRRLQNVKSIRLLLAGSYRPGAFTLRQDGSRHPLQVVVNEINRYWPDTNVDMTQAIGGEPGRAFVDALLDTEPNRLGVDFRNRLFDHTEGHPLFTVEILRLLQDRGVLTKNDQGQWAISQPVTFRELPDTVEAVIRERIARLTQDLRDILTCGSVEGERFTAEVISRVRQIDELHLAEKLGEELARQHRLIQEESEGQPPRLRLHFFQFVHTLFHQYIYHNLGNMQRQLLHRAVGEALEILYEDDPSPVAAQLARHFIETSETEKAIRYAILAGDRFREAYSNIDAIESYSKAREIIASTAANHQQESYRIARSLSQIYALQGRTAGQQIEIERMQEAAQALQDAGKLAEGAIFQVRLYTQTGLYEKARQTGAAALDYARKAKDNTWILQSHLASGEASAFLARHDEALRHFEEALRLSELAGAGQEAEVIRHIALVHLNRNEYPEALSQAQQALALYRKAGDRVGENETLRYIGDIHAGLGDYQQALNDYQEVLRIRREIGQRAREGGALGDIGDVYLFLGFYKRSLDLHYQSLAINEEVDYAYGRTWCHHDIGLIHLNMGSPQAGREELKKALALAEEIQAQNLIVLSKNDLSRAFREIGGPENLASSLKLAWEAREAGERFSLIFGQVVGESYLAMTQLQMGELLEAQEHSRSAIELLQQHGASELIEEEIYFNHSQVLMEAGETGEGQKYLQKAYDEVMKKADRIQDSAMQSSFMKKVPLNREIISSWKGRAG
jgi:predicted ATPase